MGCFVSVQRCAVKDLSEEKKGKNMSKGMKAGNDILSLETEAIY